MARIPMFPNGLPRTQSGKAERLDIPRTEPLSGMGMNISAEDALDLLRRLHCEKSPVQAVFTSMSGVTSTLRGVLQLPVYDTLCAVKSEVETTGSAVSFDLSTAVVRKFEDDRSMRGDSAFPLLHRFHSALSFAFADGSTLILFEIDETRPGDNS